MENVQLENIKLPTERKLLKWQFQFFSDECKFSNSVTRFGNLSPIWRFFEVPDDFFHGKIAKDLGDFFGHYLTLRNFNF
jgi:hypothetical protein